MTGKHPADLCPNAKAGKKSCHSCGACGTSKASTAAADEDVIAAITKKVMEQLGK